MKVIACNVRQEEELVHFDLKNGIVDIKLGQHPVCAYVKVGQEKSKKVWFPIFGSYVVDKNAAKYAYELATTGEATTELTEYTPPPPKLTITQRQANRIRHLEQMVQDMVKVLEVSKSTIERLHPVRGIDTIHWIEDTLKRVERGEE